MQSYKPVDERAIFPLTANRFDNYYVPMGAFWNSTIRPSVSWCSCLGYRHAGCLQLSHRRPLCGLRTRPRTDVDPPRLLPPSNWHRRRGHIVSPSAGAIPCILVLFGVCLVAWRWASRHGHRSCHLVVKSAVFSSPGVWPRPLRRPRPSEWPRPLGRPRPLEPGSTGSRLDATARNWAAASGFELRSRHFDSAAVWQVSANIGRSEFSYLHNDLCGQTDRRTDGQTHGRSNDYAMQPLHRAVKKNCRL